MQDAKRQKTEVDEKSVCYYVASNFVQYHCQFFVAFTLLIFGISAIALSVDGGMILSEQSSNDLTVNSHKASLLNDALNNAKSLTDATATVSRKVRERETPEMSRGSLSLMFSSKNGGDIFTPTNLAKC